MLVLDITGCWKYESTLAHRDEMSGRRGELLDRRGKVLARRGEMSSRQNIPSCIYGFRSLEPRQNSISGPVRPPLLSLAPYSQQYSQHCGLFPTGSIGIEVQ